MMNYTGPQLGAPQYQETSRINQPVPEAPKVSTLYQVITQTSQALKDCHAIMDRLNAHLVGPEPQGQTAQPVPGPRGIHEAAKEMCELIGALQQRLYQFESQL